MPSHLEADGRRILRKLVPILQHMRVLTEADGIAWGNLCDSYSTMVQAQKKLRETGMLLKTPSGYVQQNPLISIVSSSMETVNKLAKEVGLTPAARMRICAEPPGEEMDNIERLFCMQRVGAKEGGRWDCVGLRLSRQLSRCTVGILASGH
jgi:P27 family predicted phage terminase small subunit